MNPASVTTVAAGEADRAIDTIVLSFGTDPPARWMFPQPRDYLTHFPQFARAFGGAAFQHGSAYRIDGFAGVALWLPPGAQPDEKALGELLERAVDPVVSQQVFAILEKLGQYHPTHSHWYLPMTGVDPARQRNGYGSAMLRHALERVDREHLPAYLESTNPANIPLYERHGFEVMGKIQVADAPPLFPMLRQAR